MDVFDSVRIVRELADRVRSEAVYFRDRDPELSADLEEIVQRVEIWIVKTIAGAWP